MHVYEIAGANIVFEVFDGEVVLVNLDSGKYYSIRNTGAYVWNNLVKHCAIDKVIANLDQSYPEHALSINDDVNNFVGFLKEEGLIKKSAVAAADELIAPPVGAYASPTAEAFSDMQEILLLDPVHDVDESGWPVAQK
jgi:Coenzyme PQQ synthesis protein D (PqqD)